jgi:hypothetical protein
VTTYRDALFNDAVLDDAQPAASTAADARVMSNLELAMISLHSGSIPEQNERPMAALLTRDPGCPKTFEADVSDAWMHSRQRFASAHI